jgi:hypothetical protein
VAGERARLRPAVGCVAVLGNTVPLLNDGVREGDEVFFVSLNDPGGGAVLGGRKLASVVIRDDDRPPSVAAVTLVMRKKRRPARLVVHVTLSNGDVREFVSPFQRTRYQGIAARPTDSNGDGTADAVRLTARRGRKRFARVVAIA